MATGRIRVSTDKSQHIDVFPFRFAFDDKARNIRMWMGKGGLGTKVGGEILARTRTFRKGELANRKIALGL